MANYRLQSELKGKFKSIRDGLSFLDIQTGWLGQNATAAPTSGADTGKVWVRLGNENAVAIQAMNINTRTDIPNLKVRVGKVPGANEYAVMDVHPDILNTQAAYAATLNQPLRQPELLYGERVFMERLTNLRLYPGDGLTLNVEKGYYRQPDGTWVGFAGDSVDLTSVVPGTVNQKRLVLIGVEYATGNLVYTGDGTYTAIAAVSQYTDPRDGKLFTVADVAVALNAASSDVKWLGAIPLIYGQTHLNWLFQYTALGHVAESLAGQYVSISGDTMTGALFIDGSADEVQLKVQGHSTQTSNLVVIEDSVGTGYISVDGSGDLSLNDVNVILGTTTGTQIGTSTSQKLGFYGTTPITQPTALTTPLTQISHTGPATPDYAIATPVDSGVGSAWGFSTQDEFETALSVILNLQTRIDELETKLQALGVLA